MSHILKIEASAGAGKTYRLTNRFLELLGHLPPKAEHLRSIVAITFTNKAAAEMKERLIRALKEIALSSPEGKERAQEVGLSPETARAWLEIIFEHYQNLQVRTIDSLVFTILKGVALEAGLRPDLEAELKEDLLLARAYDRLLLNLRGDEKLRELFREVLLTFLEIEARGGFNPERRIRYVLLDLFRYEQKEGDLREAPVKAALEELAEKVKKKASYFLEVLRQNQGRLRRQNWEEKFLTPLEDPGAFVFHKDSVREIVSRAKDWEEVESAYQDFRRALEDFLLARAIVRLVPYTRLYQRLKKELETLREQEGLIHGGAWISLVEKILREEGVPLIYCKLGTRFRHFLIDEFQDTSRQQWEALKPLVEEALSQGGSLTYVGDIKQAIYVWRGGDPRLFVEVPQELPAHLTEEPLPFNWRSLEDLVGFNNRFFALLAEETLARWVAISLLYGRRAPKEALRCPWVGHLTSHLQEIFSRVSQELPRQRPGGRVEIVPLTGKTNQEREEKTRQLASRIIPELFHRLSEEGKSLAILVRTNEQAEEMARLLFELEIPAVTENALRLSSSRLIRAIVSLLTFLDYPYHDVALAGFLRSELARPFFTPVNDLLAQSKGRPLWEFLQETQPEAFSRYLAPLLEKAGFLSPYDLVREILDRFQVWERFPSEEAFLNRFLSLVLFFEQEGAGLSAFLEHWAERGLEERLGLPEEIRAVRILTIHAAKGLEFDVVVLPYLHWELRVSSLVALPQGYLSYVQRPYPGPVKERVLEEKCLQGLEMLNLLYVAFTRAREELYLFVPQETEGRGTRFGTGDIVKRLLKEGGFLKDETKT